MLAAYKVNSYFPQYSSFILRKKDISLKSNNTSGGSSSDLAEAQSSVLTLETVQKTRSLL